MIQEKEYYKAFNGFARAIEYSLFTDSSGEEKQMNQIYEGQVLLAEPAGFGRVIHASFITVELYTFVGYFKSDDLYEDPDFMSPRFDSHFTDEGTGLYFKFEPDSTKEGESSLVNGNDKLKW